MPVDDVKFGEMIGTVGALVTAVSDVKAAIIPALKEVRQEMALYREETRNRQDAHEKLDAVIHVDVVDLKNWMLGDGTPEDLGAKKTLNSLVNDRMKTKAWAGGIATVVSGLIGLTVWAVETLHK